MKLAFFTMSATYAANLISIELSILVMFIGEKITNALTVYPKIVILAILATENFRYLEVEVKLIPLLI